MTISLTAELPPLEMTPDGVMRVGGTRVTLDTVVAAFREGATAEGIVEQYPALALGDVYLVIGYCLRHEAEIEAYLERREREAAEVRRENERRSPPQGLRERLLSRSGKTRE